MKIAQEVRAYQEAFIRILFPAVCGLCQSPLSLDERRACRSCERSLSALCFSPDQRSIDQKFHFIDHAWALYPYSGSVKDLLHRVKFEGQRWLLEIFRESMADWAAGLHAERLYDLIIPMPLSREKLLERNFNQAGILAHFAGAKSNLPVRTDLLSKAGSIPSQSRLNREERRLNLWESFLLRNSRHLKDRRVLLVDDVLTTGATAEEAAKTLKKGGARSVDALVLAFTPQHKRAGFPEKEAAR